MAVTAVAGGTGGIGKAIVDQLIASSPVNHDKVPDDTQDGPKYIKADYDDVSSLTRMLEDNNVDTVISAINLLGGVGTQSQLNLIQAAKESKTTTTFIPSEYAHMATREEAENDPAVAGIFQSADMLKASGLKYTRFIVGFIMDFWGMPNIPSTMNRYTWAIDVAGKKAAIPGSGNDIISLLYSVDLAKVLVRMLDVDDWPEYSIVIGTDITFNDMLAKAEEIRGSKFDVAYDTQETLEKHDATVLRPSFWEGEAPFDDATLKELASLFGLMATSGTLYAPKEGRLNERFPDLHALTFDEMLQQAWGGKQ